VLPIGITAPFAFLFSSAEKQNPLWHPLNYVIPVLNATLSFL
jgi:hypothetical protein